MDTFGICIPVMTKITFIFFVLKGCRYALFVRFNKSFRCPRNKYVLSGSKKNTIFCVFL